MTTQTEALRLALEALQFALHVGFPESSESQIKKGEKAYQQHRAAITAIKEALAQPDQDEVDIRSRLYQRIHELECVLKDIAEYTGEGPPTTDWQGIVKLISDSARNALEDKEIKQPEQEPVAYIHRNEFNEYRLEPTDNFKITDLPVGVEMMLYTTPPQRNPLTDDEMWKLWNSQGDDAMEQQAAIAFARDIEAAHNIKE